MDKIRFHSGSKRLLVFVKFAFAFWNAVNKYNVLEIVAIAAKHIWSFALKKFERSEMIQYLVGLFRKPATLLQA